jgi:L-lactate dehydrogenase (cytochrome)
MKPVSVRDYRRLAERHLPPFLFEYIDGGAIDEQTLRSNIQDLAAVVLRQRVLTDVSALDTTAHLFGSRQRIPLVLAPVGLAGMNRRRGEISAARAAERFGASFCLSTVSTCSLSEVADATEAPFWFQLYMMRDRGFMRDLLQKADESGCSALVFTVDMPLAGIRYRDYRSGLAGEGRITGAVKRLAQALRRPRWTWDVGVMGRPHTLGNIAPALTERPPLQDFFAWMARNFDPRVSWRDLEEIRAHWRRPLIIKGILDPADARQAVALGADGVVVSNHGGRQLDGALSTTRALPAVVDAVGEQTTVLVDGGVRSGVDVARMLSLGADGVMIGRAWVYALAAAGESGVHALLCQIEAELRVTMALSGTVRVEDFGVHSIQP